MAFIVTDAKAACSGATCCTVSSGVTTAPTFAEGSCDTEPASYGITIYEKYLCNEIPTVPADGTAYNLDVGTKCFRTLHNSTGATVDMRKQTVALALMLHYSPPNGVYTYGVMIMKMNLGSNKIWSLLKQLRGCRWNRKILCLNK